MGKNNLSDSNKDDEFNDWTNRVLDNVVPDDNDPDDNNSEDNDPDDNGVDDDENEDEESDEEALNEEQEELLEYEKMQMKRKYIESMPSTICLEWLQEQNLVEWSQEHECYKFLYSDAAWDYLMMMHEARLNDKSDDHYSDSSND